MISSRAGRVWCVSAWLLVAAGLAPGCGGSTTTTGSYCEKVCDCIGCNASEREDCADTVDDARKVADGEGCAALFDAYLSCVEGETTCVNDEVDADGCEAELDALAACAGPITLDKPKDCASRCEAANKCEGATQVDCANACANAAELVSASGCQAEYDAVNACTDAIPDVCAPPAGACDAEASVFVDCVLDFCMANPNDPVCN